jgi:DNA invertase Pin-like site-specific DNA recombinase
MKIVIYCRTSTALQHDGLAAQEGICRSFLTNLLAQDHWKKRFAERTSASGKLLVEVVNEHISGSVAFAKRPVAGALLATDKSGLQRGDHLCLAKLDRAFRSARDCHNTLEELKQRGVSTSVCDLPNGEDVSGNGIAALLIGIMASVSEWERERIRERTADQKRVAKERGDFLGGRTPWEKRKVMRDGKVVKLVDDPKKVEVVKKIRQWRNEGKPLRDIAARVEKFGLAISTDAIRRLSDDVPGAVKVKQRGQRKRKTTR